jgi:SNF2 family DNA or RNA helicase
VVETLIFDDAILGELRAGTDEDQKRALFLEQHSEYPTHFLVNSFDPLYSHKLKDQIGPYRAVSMFKLDQFKDRAEQEGYEKLIFTEDPAPVFQRVENLNEPYPFDLNGIELYKFQLQGFNYLRDSLADIVNWSTGAGKSVFAVAKAQYLLKNDLVDTIVVASRNHNKINWQRTFAEIVKLDATIVEGKASASTLERRAQRAEQYKHPIIVLNYEKFRFRGKPLKGQTREVAGDGEEMLDALKGKRVYFIWDEMPTKLKNMSTATYKGAAKIVKATKIAYQSMLSATPLENEPEDIYSCVKMLTLKTDKVFKTKNDFRRQYALAMNPWAKWQVASWNMEALQEMGLRLAHMTHQADKYRDPEIASQFPQETWEDIIIDMSEQDRKIYSLVEKKIAEEFGAGYDEILSKLLVLQLICNNPSTLKLSESELARLVVEKKEPTDKYCAKLETLRDLLEQIGGKVVLFTMYNDLGAKLLADYIADWGFTYVLFDGNAKKKQDALDRFRADRRIKIFLSSDQGSDSINLEQATTVINYDLPWKHSTLTQRVNRISRITSTAERVYYFNLIVANTMEERKMKLLKKKKGWEDAIFRGEIADQADIMSRFTMEDLKYLALGETG